MRAGHGTEPDMIQALPPGGGDSSPYRTQGVPYPRRVSQRMPSSGAAFFLDNSLDISSGPWYILYGRWDKMNENAFSGDEKMVASSTRINALDSFGTPSSSRTDPIKAMEAADGLYGLRKVLLAEFAGCKSSDANDDLHVVVRTDTGRAIGAVGNSYECFANREFFGPTADALIETGARIDRFQTLADGTRAFMRLSWADDLNLTIGRPKVGDLVGRRCTLSTSHDGKWAGKFTFQMLRLACSNGMTAPVGTFDTTLTHTVGGHQQLIDLQKLVPLIDLYVRQFEHAANV
ncbi:hypothetical protein LCGC14_1510620, partial [marine sediment metagenome]